MMKVLRILLFTFVVFMAYLYIKDQNIKAYTMCIDAKDASYLKFLWNDCSTTTFSDYLIITFVTNMLHSIPFVVFGLVYSLCPAVALLCFAPYPRPRGYLWH